MSAAHEAMFAALCIELGFCLHEKGQARVVAALGDGVEAAVKAVFEAEGSDFISAPRDLRRAVRDCIRAHLPAQ